MTNFVILSQDSPCDPCMVHCCLHWCAICQEHREMKNHLSSDNTNTDGTITNPPPVQEIKSDLNNESTSSASSSTKESSSTKDEHNNLEIQPV
jgi:hypothetical protein